MKINAEYIIIGYINAKQISYQGSERIMSTKGKFVRPRLLTIILAAVIAASSVTDALCIYDMFNTNLKAYGAAGENTDAGDPETAQAAAERENAEKARAALIDAGHIMFDPAVINTSDDPTVTNNDQAFTLLKEIGSEYGITNVSEEYKNAETVDTLDNVFYNFQQMHNNIDVLGGKMSVKTDRSGNVLDIIGKHLPVPPTVPTESKIDNTVMDNAVKFLMKKDFGLSDSMYRLNDNGLKIAENENGGYGLYKEYTVNMNYTDKPAARALVNAETGKVEGISTSLKKTCSDDKAKSKAGTTVKKKEDIKPQYKTVSEEEALLRDDDRNIEVHKVEKKDNKATPETLANSPVYSWNPKTSAGETVSLDTLDNLQKAYDFFRNMFFRKGINNNDSTTAAYVGVKDYNDGLGSEKMTDNAAVTADGKIIIGEKTDENGKVTNNAVTDTDEMGYLFAQGIISCDSDLDARILSDSDKSDKTEQKAIAEGVSQILGEMVQDQAADGKMDGSCDWKNSKGDMSKPAISDYSEYKEFTNTPEEGASLITYPVFEMHEKISTAQIADLCYDSIGQLGAYTDFIDYRSIFEKNAAKMNCDTAAGAVSDESKKLTDEQLETIIDAFDKVGIPSCFDKTIVSGGQFRIYGKDNHLYQNYNIKFTRLYDSSKTIIDEDVNSESFTIPSSVANGIYNVTVTDLLDESIREVFTVVVNDNAKDQKTADYPAECKIFTDFGMAPRDVVMVLDLSGSMHGKPIEQTRIAASKFVDTVLEASPATRISIVTYSSDATTVIGRSNDRIRLKSITESLSTGGDTNMYSGLQSADQILDSSNSEKKMIVLMSDGAPNRGESSGGGYDAALKRYSSEIKKKDVTIYSLGFFHSLSGSTKTRCQTLMQAIATPGYYYEIGSAEDTTYLVGDAENALAAIFSDMADQINGGKYIYIRVACPVDVTVSYNGETLSSDKDNMNTRTDFGTLFITTAAEEAISGIPSSDEEESEEESSEEETGSDNFFSQYAQKEESSSESTEKTAPEDDEVKILRLAADKVYEISINGTGEGKMDYSISYPDDEGNYTDVRNFKDIPITKTTAVSTNTEKKNKVDLLVDSNGDGKTDITYSASQNEEAKQTTPITPLTIAIIILSVITAGLLAWEIVLIVKRAKFNKYCQSCGSVIGSNDIFCPECGAKKERKNLFLPEKIERKKQSKAVIITKCAVMGVFAVSAIVMVIISQSPAVNVYKNLRDGNTTFAQTTYRNSVKGSSLAEGQTASLTNNYLDKAYSQYKNGNYSYEDMRTVMSNAVSIGNSDITKKAEEYLKAGEENEKKKDPEQGEEKDKGESRDETNNEKSEDQ